MDDRISKNIHRELRTMNGKLDEMGVVSRILTDSIKEQTAQMKRSTRHLLGGLASAAVSTTASIMSQNNLSASMSNMANILQKKTMARIENPNVTNISIQKSSRQENSLTNEVKISNTEELGLAIAKHIGASLTTSLLLRPPLIIGGTPTGEKKDEKQKNLWDHMNEVNDQVSKAKSMVENTKYFIELFKKKKDKGAGTGKCNCCCCSGDGSVLAGDILDELDGNERERRQKDKDGSRNGQTGKQSDDKKTGEKRRFWDRWFRKDDPKTKEIADASKGRNSPAPKRAPKLKKFSKSAGLLLLLGLAGDAAQNLSETQQESEDVTTLPDLTREKMEEIVASVDAMQSFRAVMNPVMEATKSGALSGKPAFSVVKTAVAVKEASWIKNALKGAARGLLRGAKTASDATKIARLNPLGLIGGLALDVGISELENYLTSEDEDREPEEVNTQVRLMAKPMLKIHPFQKNSSSNAFTPFADGNATASINGYRPMTDTIAPNNIAVPSGGAFGAPHSPMVSNQGMINGGNRFDVSANSNVTMNLNVNGYIDNRMIEEIKRIAREQFEASFRAFERGISEKVPNPKPFPRPQVAEGGMMSY